MGAELYYLNSGSRTYAKAPVALHTRPYWEFQAVIGGTIAPVLEEGAAPFQSRRLWISAAGHQHGWTGCARTGACSR